jgi:predicted TPR repeat methyltransferase
MSKSFENFWEFIVDEEGVKYRVEIILDIIKQYQPDAKKVLELGVGIGLVVGHLIDKFEISGLDIDEDYIKVCQNKYPKANFYVLSMHNFTINERFDVIYSIDDSVNYLESLDQYKSTFQRVNEHLIPKGLFIFDLYTNEMLKYAKNQIEMGLSQFFQFSKGFIVISTRVENDLLILDCKVFEFIGNNHYELHEYDSWVQKILPPDEIEEELKVNFEILEKKFSEQGRRIYFISRKK